MNGGKVLVRELEEKIIMDDNLFFINGVRRFIEDHEKENKDIYLKEIIYINKIYESKRKTIRFIKVKRKEYKEKMLSIENNIIILSNTLKDLELEKNIRDIKIKECNEHDNNFKEKLEDIIDAMSENKRIIDYEKDRVNDIRVKYNNFNDTSLEEENIVHIFYNYIKREFKKERRIIIELLNSNNLEEVELMLTYEYLLILTKKIICIQEDLFGG